MSEILKRAPDISVVLACYRAEKFLEESFRQIEEVLSHSRFSYEIIIVDDKSPDNTAAVIEKIRATHPYVHVIYHRKNHGRGKTVYDGFRAAKGKVLGFIDVDLDNPARYILPLAMHLLAGRADVCTARRIYLMKADLYLMLRWLLSRGYSQLVKIFFGVKLVDTETGCKFFLREKIMPVLREVKNRGWFWDTETMLRAYYKGLLIVEMPTVFVRNSHVSTVDIVPDILKYLVNLWRFRKEIKSLKQSPNVSNTKRDNR